jgi:hypothetical protein
MSATLRSTLLGGVCGFLTRPCCVGPLLLSIVGTTGAGLSASLTAYGPELRATSALLLATSLWMNVRSETHWANKVAAVVGAAAAFVLTMIGSRWL